jgi:hypothetical protein
MPTKKAYDIIWLHGGNQRCTAFLRLRLTCNRDAFGMMEMTSPYLWNSEQSKYFDMIY